MDRTILALAVLALAIAAALPAASASADLAASTRPDHGLNARGDATARLG